MSRISGTHAEPKQLPPHGKLLYRYRPQKGVRISTDDVPLPDRVVKSHREVADAFGVSPNTVKNSWAPAGMPGSPGAYSLNVISAWRANHLVDNSEKQTAADLSNSELEREQAEEELRKIKLQNDKLEREEQIAAGKVIDRESVETALRTLFAVHAERMMKVMAQLEPSLPVDCAADVVSTGDRLIRRELVGLSETCARDILKEGTELVDL